MINSPYTLSSNSIHTSTPKAGQLVAKNDLKQSDMSVSKQNVETLEKDQETCTAEPKNSSVHLYKDKAAKSEDNNTPELSKFHSFISSVFHSSDQISDHHNSLKSCFSSPIFSNSDHHSDHNSLSPKMDPIPSKISALDLDLGLKAIASDSHSPLPEESRNAESSSQEIQVKRDFLSKNSFCNHSGPITLYDESSCTPASCDTTDSCNTTNSLPFNDNKLPSITILMGYDLEPSNTLSLSNTDDDYLKHRNTQKMSIRFLCNESITKGGIDILEEVAKIIN